MTRRTASQLIAAGIDHATIHVGRDLRPVHAAALSEGARAWFDDGEEGTAACVLTNDASSIGLVLAAVLHGFPLVSLPAPPRTDAPAAYLQHLADIMRAVGARAAVARDDIAATLDGGGIPTVPHSTLGRRRVAAGSSAFELVQFSSGTTGPSTGTRLDDEKLGRNMSAILARIRPRPGDNIVSWLPLSHDMGLVGMLLSAVAGLSPSYAAGGTVSILPTETFVRRPSSWLQLITDHRGTITAGPDVGYRLATLRAPSYTDLSSLRCAIAGGEIVRPSTLSAFTEAFAPMGLARNALCPAYGMAEIGLAATISDPEEPWGKVSVSSAQLAEGRLETDTREDGALVDLATCGRPLDGYEIKPSPGSGGAVGALSIRGPSIGTRLDRTDLADGAGWFATSDLGALVDGQVIVVGRRDDQLVVNGRNVAATAIEEVVARIDGVRSGRVVAVGLPDGGWILAVEPSSRSHRPDVRRLAAASTRTAGAQPDDIVVLERGQLPFTTSGKVRRAELVRRYLTGELAQAGTAYDAT